MLKNNIFKVTLVLIIFNFVLFYSKPILAATCDFGNGQQLEMTIEQCNSYSHLGAHVVTTEAYGMPFTPVTNPDAKVSPSTSYTSKVNCNLGGKIIFDMEKNVCAAMKGYEMPATQVPLLDDPLISNMAKEKPEKAVSVLPGITIGVSSIQDYIKSIYIYAIGIVGILSTIVIMIGGLIWISSMGNAARVTSAKDWIGAALSGLALAMFSYMLLWIINPDLVSLKPLDIEKVNEIGVEVSTEMDFNSPCENDNHCATGFICNPTTKICGEKCDPTIENCGEKDVKCAPASTPCTPGITLCCGTCYKEIESAASGQCVR